MVISCACSRGKGWRWYGVEVGWGGGDKGWRW